ncbi:hypothetical protein F5Y16DRAFT_329474 [Xylariaceae sp. FL0255]|nr:hypothetical protein F5Y16DRAFT_329474 [Xylariaceae sp. FL0255]
MARPVSIALGLSLLGGVSSSALPKRASIPTVQSATVIGNVADPSLNRDSCGSSLIGSRSIWTCRDTQGYDSSGVPDLPVWSSSASWTNFNSDGTPSTTQYGGSGSQTPFFIYASDECGDSSDGACSDGTRYALWPDSPPLVTSNDGTTVTAYTWIINYHIQGLTPLDSDPPVSLYRLTYDLSTTDENTLPTVILVNEHFWADGSIPYGAYGNVIQDGVAYLFGKPSNGAIALAMVPVGSIEDTSAYQYWVNGAWTTTLPGIDTANIGIDNASAGGQGTYYYSTYSNQYFWIGQASISVSADFYVTTADDITGPWGTPTQFYSGVNGNYSLGAYSLQAHPDLLSSHSASTNEIYLTYTKNDVVGDNVSLYTTPLIHVVWN